MNCINRAELSEEGKAMTVKASREMNFELANPIIYAIYAVLVYLDIPKDALQAFVWHSRLPYPLNLV